MKKHEKTRIKFSYEGEDYTLEYTADSLKKMQKEGFNFAEAERYALSLAEDLFSGAFIANHNNVPKKRRQEIFHDLSLDGGGGEDLFDVLTTMVSEAVEEINYHSGNTKWEVVR